MVLSIGVALLVGGCDLGRERAVMSLRSGLLCFAELRVMALTYQVHIRIVEFLYILFIH